MGLFDIFKQRTATKSEQKIIGKEVQKDTLFQNNQNAIADSQSIAEDERAYYQEDSYYTLYSYPGTPMAQKVITFEERKKISYPSVNGLYVAEILLLEYCSYGKYPKPKSGYPGMWWFGYGIRDVGHALESLEKRGYLRWSSKKNSLKGLKVDELKQILLAENLSTNGKKADLIERIKDNVSEERIVIPDYSPKYELTELGKQELEQNGYVPYMHKHPHKTTEDEHFGEVFNVWSINKQFPNGDASSWKSVVGSIEKRLFGVDTANANPEINATVPQETTASIAERDLMHRLYTERHR